MVAQDLQFLQHLQKLVQEVLYFLYVQHDLLLLLGQVLVRESYWYGWVVGVEGLEVGGEVGLRVAGGFGVERGGFLAGEGGLLGDEGIGWGEVTDWGEVGGGL